jgi:hypothetical protein
MHMSFNYTMKGALGRVARSDPAEEPSEELASQSSTVPPNQHQKCCCIL